MHSPWPALHAQLVRSTHTLAFQLQFKTTTGAEPTLSRFVDPPALLDALHGPEGKGDARNAILAALVRRAMAAPEPATTLLLLALWPGLDAVHRRLSRHFRGRPDALVSEITSRAVAGIRFLDLGKVHRIAATLIRNCERDIVRSLQREAREGRPLVPSDWEAIAASPQPDVDADRAVLRLLERLRLVVGTDAPLVIAIAVVGERQEDVAAAFGLSHEAGRKRYQRALKRVRVVAEDFF